MKIGESGATFASMPPNLQTAENYAFGYAVDRQMAKLNSFSERLRVWTDLEHVNPRYYGMIAACIRSLYYNSSYDDKTKLTILKNAMKVNRYAGSRKAVDQLISDVYGSAEFHPWYEYGGQPYHFKITTDTVLAEDIIERFSEILERAKRLRSIMDNIMIHRGIDQTYYFRGNGVSWSRSPAILADSRDDLILKDSLQTIQENEKGGYDNA